MLADRAAPHAALRQACAVTGFTAHNIALPDGTETLPGVQLVADTGICRAALRAFGLFLGPGARIADLGCLEGGYAVAFARAGYRVTGIEARAGNYARCREVAAAVDLPGLNFSHGDVRDMERHGEFDGVFCCGLLYHLDKPVSFLRLLGKVTRRVLIVQSHYAAHPETAHEGRSGSWQHDSPEEGVAWGSHGNASSFWLARPDLLAAMRDAGFACVFEQHDYRRSIAGGVYKDQFGNPETDRGMFTGVKC